MVSRYVHFENIKRFEDMLLTETSPKKRAVILALLAEERAQDIDIHDGPAPSHHGDAVDPSADAKP